MAESLINRVLKKIPPKAFSFLIVLLTTFLVLSCENDRSKEIPLSNVWEHRKYQNELLDTDSSFLQKNYKKLYESNINDPNAFYLYRRLLYGKKNEETNHLDSLLLSKFIKYQKNTFILSLLATYHKDNNNIYEAERYNKLSIEVDKNNLMGCRNLANIYLESAFKWRDILSAKYSIYYYRILKSGKYSDTADISHAIKGINMAQSIIAEIKAKEVKDRQQIIDDREKYQRGTESYNSASNDCTGFGNQGCIEKIRSNFGNTGKNILEERYLGDGRFSISFMDSQYPGAYTARISTDCNCNITSTNVSTIR